MVLGWAEGTAGRSGYLEEVRQIRWGEVIDGLEGKQMGFVIDSLDYWGPVEPLQDGGDVMEC